MFLRSCAIGTRKQADAAACKTEAGKVMDTALWIILYTAENVPRQNRQKQSQLCRFICLKDGLVRFNSQLQIAPMCDRCQ